MLRWVALPPELLAVVVAAAFVAPLALDHSGGPGPAGLASFATLTEEGGVVTGLAFSPDGRTLAVARSGEGATIWDVESRRRRRILPATRTVAGLAFSPDGEVLATADQGPAIRLWDPVTGESLGTLECPGRRFFWLSYSPDGRTLASSSKDASVMLWDVPTAKVVDTHRGQRVSPDSLAFSPDGRTLIFAERGGSILMWDVECGRIRAEVPAHAPGIRSSPALDISVAFSPDGKVLASHGALDPLLKLWEVESGRLLDTIEVEPSHGKVVAFTPDGRALILAGLGTVREWCIAGRRSKTLADGLPQVRLRLAMAAGGPGTLAIAEGGRLALRERDPPPGPGADSSTPRARAAAPGGGSPPW